MGRSAVRVLAVAAAFGWWVGGGWRPHVPAPATAQATIPAQPAGLGLDPPHAEAGTITIARGWEGHFFVSGDVAGRPLRFLVDTGATSVALSLDDARAIGVDVDALRYDGQAQTAAGPTAVASVTLPRLRIGDIQLLDVRAAVLRDAPPGIALLGQTFLSRIDRVSIEGDRLTLTKL